MTKLSVVSTSGEGTSNGLVPETSGKGGVVFLGVSYGIDEASYPLTTSSFKLDGLSWFWSEEDEWLSCVFATANRFKRRSAAFASSLSEVA